MNYHSDCKQSPSWMLSSLIADIMVQKGSFSMMMTMDISEVLLYLELRKKDGKRLTLPEYKVLLYFLEDYQHIEVFYKKIKELQLNPPFKFYIYSLIYFIEDYDVCTEIKTNVFQKTKRKYSDLYIQLILLSQSQEQAIAVIKEAQQSGIRMDWEGFSERFNSMWRIKQNQKAWRDNISRQIDYFPFTEIYEDFNNTREKYFMNLSLTSLKQKVTDAHTKVTTTSVFSRSILIKEFAKRVANGICQLCEQEAPFLDRNNKPFLEVHHIHYLSQGGNDTIDNVVALCPNCHRKIHHLELAEDVYKIRERAIELMK